MKSEIAADKKHEAKTAPEGQFRAHESSGCADTGARPPSLERWALDTQPVTARLDGQWQGCGDAQQRREDDEVARFPERYAVALPVERPWELCSLPTRLEGGG